MDTRCVEHFDDNLQLPVCCRRLSTFYVALQNIFQTLDNMTQA